MSDPIPIPIVPGPKPLRHFVVLCPSDDGGLAKLSIIAEAVAVGTDTVMFTEHRDGKVTCVAEFVYANGIIGWFDAGEHEVN